MQKVARMAQTDPDEIWESRLREGKLGVYSALRTVERAAASREQVSLFNVPGREVVARMQPLERTIAFANLSSG